MSKSVKEHLKIAVVGIGGGSGKTSIASQCLYPRMDSPLYIAVESINQTAEDYGIPVTKLRGQQFKEIYRLLLPPRSVILDLGANQSEAVIEGLATFDRSHERFDLFIVPVIQDSKEQTEAIKMIMLLQQLGVENDKIRVVFNRAGKTYRSDFSTIINYLESDKSLSVIDTKAIIPESQLYSLLAIRNIGIQDLVDDQIDYDAIVMSSEGEVSEEEREHALDMLTMQAMASSLYKNLNEVFERLTGVLK